MNLKKQFLYACRDGDFEKVQTLLKNNPNIKISCDNELAFKYACQNGHLKVAQYLLSVKPNINISADNEWAFRYACYFEHLQVAQWLLKVKPDINISDYNEFAFQCACENGHLEVVKWLQTINPFKYVVEVENNKLIRWKVNANYDEKLLFMLYTLTNKGYTNNLSANLVLDICKYL